MEAARPAVPADLDAAAQVLTRVEEEMAGLRGGPLFLAREAAVGFTGRSSLSASLDEPDRLAVVGCYDGVVLGWSEARIETLPDGRRLGVVEVLAVDPEARGVGIGEAMMDLLVDQLRVAGCIGVDARTLPGDRETKNFFERFGLKARLLTVHRSFDDDPATPGPGLLTGPA